MFKYLLFMLLCAASAFAQDVSPAVKTASKPAAPSKPVFPRVRTGVVIKAEFTADKPEAQASSRILKQSSPAWAVLTLELDPGRAASVFDYVLSKNGTEYPCLDLSEGDGPFEGKLRIYSSPNNKICRMVFAVPSAEDEYEIVFKLIPGQEMPVKLKVKNP
ncbi:MAG: hypothetical protein J5858_07260 [Lentisphaeria bacterium]|nr:hypothetical protein [Lentisphaeria bacterium]